MGYEEELTSNQAIAQVGFDVEVHGKNQRFDSIATRVAQTSQERAQMKLLGDSKFKEAQTVSFLEVMVRARVIGLTVIGYFKRTPSKTKVGSSATHTDKGSVPSRQSSAEQGRQERSSSDQGVKQPRSSFNDKKRMKRASMFLNR